LRGTSLEPAVAAKLRALDSEFSHLEAATRELPFWDDLLWQADEPVTLADWVLLDAWFRSRAVELPGLGTCMVPVLDMANHGGAAANAYYERINPGGENDCVGLILRPGYAVGDDEEVTICYGEDKSSAEMLFSYGFIDTESQTRTSMTLSVSSIVHDDPLGKAKMHVFPAAPTLTLSRERHDSDDLSTAWACQFAYLAVLNEEDGLNFQLLRSAEVNCYLDELRLFWQEDDVTDKADCFSALLATHNLEQVFELRVRAALREVLESHLQRMGEVENEEKEKVEDEMGWAGVLRTEQTALITGAVARLEKEMAGLMESESVREYLLSQQGGQDGEEAGDEEGAHVERGAAGVAGVRDIPSADVDEFA
jgi:hypothetical protein